MINASSLPTDLRKLLVRLEADLRERCGAVADMAARLQREYWGAKAAGRVDRHSRIVGFRCARPNG